MAAGSVAGGPSGQGTFRLTWRGGEIAGRINAATFDAMDETADAAKAAAQQRCPVDTGRLRESIDAIVDQSGAGQRRRLTLFAGAPYAAYVELGTVHHPAQPFLRPAIDQEAPKLTQRIRAALGGLR